MLTACDKSLAGVGEGEVAGSDVPKKMLGILLDYMSQNNGIIFGASANRTKSIPAEFLRRGRFDRIFFMDLPNDAARTKILHIHLKKHGHDLTKFTTDEVKKMVGALENFTGAEIEAVVTESIIESVVEKSTLNCEMICRLTNATRTMDKDKKDIVELRGWAANFATSAQ